MKTHQHKETYPGHHPKQTVSSNALRAAVLGANDGIVSVASIVVGVAGAQTTSSFIFAAGVAGLVAGALSMAVGEYVSVSTQSDIERTALTEERRLLELFPNEEKAELALLYQAKGLSKSTAKLVAEELSVHDRFLAHFDAELGIDPSGLISPWPPAVASAVSFTIGALIPLTAVTLAPVHDRIPFTFLAVFIALVITGTLSAKVTGASYFKSNLRVIIGGLVAMAITFGIGHIIGVKTV